jgi:hypothetical protein
MSRLLIGSHGLRKTVRAHTVLAATRKVYAIAKERNCNLIVRQTDPEAGALGQLVKATARVR